jgi:phospholipid/cholesterol/gamma-HCH transport system permease protein
MSPGAAASTTRRAPAPTPASRARQALLAWWRMLHLGAVLVVLAASPSSWRQPWRGVIAREVWLGSAPLLLGFGLISTLLSVVIMRIVLVTAQSYGLSQYALEMVVRVLVLELIPLTAALFVALRVSLPVAVELAELRGTAQRSGPPHDLALLRREVLPRAAGSFFAVLMLAALSGVICLVLAYVLVHGLSPWGLDRYTRLVGRIFDPAVTLIFVLKTAGLAAAVSLIPVGTALQQRPVAADASSRALFELRALVRMFFAILLIELASLAGNYA